MDKYYSLRELSLHLHIWHPCSLLFLPYSSSLAHLLIQDRFYPHFCDLVPTTFFSSYRQVNFLPLDPVHLYCQHRALSCPTSKPPVGSGDAPPNQNPGIGTSLQIPTVPTSYLPVLPSAVALPIRTPLLYHLLPPSAHHCCCMLHLLGSAPDWTSFLPFRLILPLAAPFQWACPIPGYSSY